MKEKDVFDKFQQMLWAPNAEIEALYRCVVKLLCAHEYGVSINSGL